MVQLFLLQVVVLEFGLVLRRELSNLGEDLLRFFALLWEVRW